MHSHLLTYIKFAAFLLIKHITTEKSGNFLKFSDAGEIFYHCLDFSAYML